MTSVTMPRLSDAMEAGMIVAWLRRDGEHVDVDQDLVEIEADKATMTYPSPAAGVLKTLVAEGDTVPVDAPIAQLVPAGQQAQPPEDAPQPAAPERPARADHGGGRRAAPVVIGAVATPVAARAAALHGLDVSTVAGSGPRGRVLKRDVLVAAGVEEDRARPPAEQPRPQVVPAEPAPATAPAGGRDGAVVHEPTPAQRTMARRMSEAKATQPDFAVELDIDMGEAIALRERLSELVAEGRPPSLNDFVVKAVAQTLRSFPRVNGAYREGMIETYPHINVGIAVASDDRLVVATVRDADRASLGQIAAQTRRLAERARSGDITPPELSGATVTISNLGMFGARAITPILNGGQAAIVGIGAVEDRPVARDGQVAIRPTMTARVVCDHRILTGAEAADFLSAVRTTLEAPLRLAL